MHCWFSQWISKRVSLSICMVLSCVVFFCLVLFIVVLFSFFFGFVSCCFLVCFDLSYFILFYFALFVCLFGWLFVLYACFFCCLFFALLIYLFVTCVGLVFFIDCWLLGIACLVVTQSLFLFYSVCICSRLVFGEKNNLKFAIINIHFFLKLKRILYIML